ncbi:MAG TPA: DUF420 domain-containing protein [Pyrinomonadaceae bacterium]|nr:DUF420 domain-containing protein [Pyrinomonadaceae bacterium]
MINLFGSEAPGASNLNLAAQICMGVALLAGMFLARRKLYKAHGICQSTVILLNLIPILSYMGPVFHRGVLPKIPAMLGDRFYALPTAHATLGTLAELLGLYIILRAGTNLLPEGLRFKNYKLWMRSELLLWWLVIILGMSTYWVWYKAEAARSPATAVLQPHSNQPQQSSLPTAIVTLSNFSFEPTEITIEPGTTVIWKDVTGRHTVRADDGSFESEVLAVGGEFQHRFEAEGRYPVHCTLHGAPGGNKMAGTITVKAATP